MEPIQPNSTAVATTEAVAGLKSKHLETEFTIFSVPLFFMFVSMFFHLSSGSSCSSFLVACHIKI